jgi:hypothetical protein
MRWLTRMLAARAGAATRRTAARAAWVSCYNTVVLATLLILRADTVRVSDC